ncbi:MAG: aldo/keto reductase [Anaerolineales bacterium]|nr:aldo/keto reductase [Anaerolineales bacterium]
MQYRIHKNFKISEIGVGCYALAGVYGEKDVAGFKAMLVKAYEWGVNIFDTAGIYGDGERILGEAVASFRQDVILATKVSPMGEGQTRLSYGTLNSACEESLHALKTDYIDLYQVHFDDPLTPVAETVAGLEKLVDQGKIRAYGVCHLPQERVKEYCHTGQIFSVLMELNAATPQARQNLLPMCQKYGVAAIAFSVTGRGILTGKFRESAHFEESDLRHMDPLFQRERRESALRIADYLAEMGQDYGKSAVQMAISWVLAQPGIVCALTGPSRIEHLEENIAASGWEIDQQDLSAVENFLEVESQRLSLDQEKSIQNILTNPLPDQADRAFIDLVYVLETSVQLGLVKEDQIMPVFLDLYALRDNLSQVDTDTLDNLQARLRNIILQE